MELKDKKAVVVGLGKSGESAAKLLKTREAKVLVLEQKPLQEVLAAAQNLEKFGIEVKAGGYGPSDFDSAQLVVLSPGVNEKEKIYLDLAQKGVEVIGELELAARLVQAPIIAVSGTDGKTTTVSLLGEIFARQYPDKVWVGGNIGNPVADLVLSQARPQVVILEVSSFQLAQAKTFHPRVAVMLNIAPDHFDRHLDFEDYCQAKLRLFMNQTKDDAAVLNYNDQKVKALAGKISSSLIWFGDKIAKNHGAFLSGQELVYRNSRQEFKISFAGWKLLGKHNLENLLAASAAAGWFGVKPEAIQEALDAFRAPEHRLEFVAEIGGVKYFDDSKATTPHAVSAAINSFDNTPGKRLILLLGGRNKQIDFTTLAQDLKERVKSVICFGEARYEIKEQLAAENIPGRLAERMADAVRSAKESAEAGNIILLSPGCASFDEFRDYKERGDQFKELVKNWK